MTRVLANIGRWVAVAGLALAVAILLSSPAPSSVQPWREVAMLLFGLATGGLVVAWGAGTVAGLRAAVQRVRAGAVDEWLPANGPGVLRALAIEFNQLLVALRTDRDGALARQDELAQQVATRTAELGLFSQAVAQANVGILVVGRTGIVEYANAALAALIGTPVAELAGQPAGGLFPALSAGLSAGREWHGEAVCWRPDGTRVWLNLLSAPLVDEQGLSSRFMVVADDVTELQTLLDAQRVFHNLADCADATGLLIVQVEPGRIEYLNAALRRLLDLAPDVDYRDRPLAEILPDVEDGLADLREALQQSIQTAGHWRQELRCRTRSGRWIEIDVSVFRLPAEDNTSLAPVGPERWAAVVSDISARRAFERSLEKARDDAEQASRAKSEFVANMSHEIRTPMNVVLGFAQILQKDAGMTPAQRRSVDAILRSGEHLLWLMNNILEISRIESGSVHLVTQSFDLPAMLLNVETIMRGRAENKGLVFVVTRAPDLPAYVHADEGKLRQILINLLDNAVKFTDKGRVDLRVSSRWDEGGDLRLVCEVEDTGAGIAALEAGKLFKPFGQVRIGSESRGGSGLGLAISRQFARLMGGDIALHSEAGRGSVFVVDVPVKRTGVVAVDFSSGRSVKAVRRDVPPPRILNVDDEALNRAMVSVLLRKMGFEVREASDGRQALQLAQSWAPALVLLDLAMPGMDGLEVLARLRADECGPRIPVIILTAHAFADERQRAFAAGADDFVRKPFRLDELLQVIARFVRVQYEYDEPEAPVPPGRSETVEGQDGALGDQPEAWRARVRTAVNEADIERLEELAAELDARSPAHAAVLRASMERFDYPGIARLL